MKIMISQPMRGKTNEEIKAERASIVEYFEGQGDEVIETIFDFPEGADPLAYLGASITEMAEADYVYFAEGWEEARGCKIERAAAEAYGKYVSSGTIPQKEARAC
jgi:hypothetical protein